jgi:hypothetical protein
VRGIGAGREGRIISLTQHKIKEIETGEKQILIKKLEQLFPFQFGFALLLTNPIFYPE